MNLRDLVREQRLIACVGAGGVGKTTLAASLALLAALHGRRAMVLTIDPARALGRALGVRELASHPAKIDLSSLGPLGSGARGSLQAAMLEQQGAWDAFIHRHAPNESVERAILDNDFYRELSRRFAGSTEYVALEELCRLDESGRYDLIVLDTPPAAHALDFVAAAERIERLLDTNVLQLTNTRGGRLALRLRRAMGAGTFETTQTLLTYFGDLIWDIRERSRQSRALLRSPLTSFVLVAGPDAGTLEDTRQLATRMTDLGLHWRATVQNRVHPLPGRLEPGSETAILEWLGALGVDGEAKTWLRAVYRDALQIARREQHDWSRFEAGLPEGLARARIFELDHDLHSLHDLALLARQLDRATDGDHR